MCAWQNGFQASCTGMSRLTSNLQSTESDCIDVHEMYGTSDAFLRLAYLAFFSERCESNPILQWCEFLCVYVTRGALFLGSHLYGGISVIQVA